MLGSKVSRWLAQPTRCCNGAAAAGGVHFATQAQSDQCTVVLQLQRESPRVSWNLGALKEMRGFTIRYLFHHLIFFTILSYTLFQLKHYFHLTSPPIIPPHPPDPIIPRSSFGLLPKVLLLAALQREPWQLCGESRPHLTLSLARSYVEPGGAARGEDDASDGIAGAQSCGDGL